MTIIQNSINSEKSTIWIVFLSGTLIIMAVFGIFSYNNSVNLKHEALRVKVSLREVETANAELKNNLYMSSNSPKLQMLAQNGSLVLEKNPEYIKKQEIVLGNN